MKSIRIGSGAGYAGDRIEPAIDIIKYGDLDYIIFECLAERTIALAQKEKLENPDKGYNNLLEYRMEKIMPVLQAHPVKIITNMGAANPTSAAEKIYEIAKKHDLPHLKIAAIEGDNVLKNLPDYQNETILENGNTVQMLGDSIISANAYIGAKQITEALASGADIIVTGRVADPSLVTGPIMYEFGKSYDDYDFLGKSIVAGHLIECSGQVTGGYFAVPGKKDVPELWNLGFPILTFKDNGDIELEKLPGTGGILNTATVKEQLLYEIQDPANYLTPDVIADFTKITVHQMENERVSVRGATGKKPTGKYKVSIGFLDGWIGEGEISYGGRSALERAKLSSEIVKKRMEILQLKFKEVRFDLIGVNSLFGNALLNENEPIEIRLRISAIANTEAEAAKIGQEVETLYTNGPAGGGGARSYLRKIVAINSILISAEVISPRIIWRGGNGV